MFGVKYHINPETLRYERVSTSPARKFLRIGLVCALLVLTSIGMRKTFENHFTSPRQQAYETHNQELRRAIAIALDADLQLTGERLSELSQRDEQLYRSILELQPLHSSVREAGIGGADRETDLNMIRDPEPIKEVSMDLEHMEERVGVQNGSLADVYMEAVEYRKFLDCRPSINPIAPGDPVWYTSMFGYRKDPFTGRRTDHHGIDLAGRTGTPIHCAGEGRVSLVRKSRFGYGNEVRVDHGYGYQSIYAHLDEISVNRGDSLERGSVIGTLGNTGRSTGPHLHYEIRYKGRAVDPVNYFVNDLSAGEYQMLVDRAMASR